MSKLLTAEYGVENIVKSFGGAKALSGVSLSVSGGNPLYRWRKWFRQVNINQDYDGVHSPDSGIIRLGDKTFSSYHRAKLYMKVFKLFSGFSLPNLSVAENIALSTFISRDSHFISRPGSNIAETALGSLIYDIDVNTPVADISLPLNNSSLLHVQQSCKDAVYG